MHWCRFLDGGEAFYGLVDGDTVRVATASPFDGGGPGDETRPLAEAKLLIPCLPPTFYAAGANYRAHLAWAAQTLGGSGAPPPRADIGYRAVNSLVAHDEAIVMGIIYLTSQTRAASLVPRHAMAVASATL